MKISFNALSSVGTANPRTAEYDLRYSAKQGRFNITQAAFTHLLIVSRTMEVKHEKSANVPILVLYTDNTGTIFRQKAGYNKGTAFTHKNLATILGLENEDKHYNIVPVEAEDLPENVAGLFMLEEVQIESSDDSQDEATNEATNESTNDSESEQMYEASAVTSIATEEDSF